MNIPCDFISIEHDMARASAYRALLLPFPLSLSEDAAAALVQYVEAGGRLISEATPGRIDAQAFCNRGELSPALAALFGVRQTGFTMVREPEGGARWSPPERTWGEYREALLLDGAGPLNGQRLRANVYLETFAPLDSEPVLRAGEEIAGVRRQAGAGEAWLLGTYAGHNGTAYRNQETTACVRALLAACGVIPDYSGRLLRRKRVLPGKEAWIFTNPTAESITESVSIAGWTEVDDLLGEPIVRAGDTIEVAVEPLDVRAVIVAR